MVNVLMDTLVCVRVRWLCDCVMAALGIEVLATCQKGSQLEASGHRGTAAKGGQFSWLQSELLTKKCWVDLQ